ncbi:MAG: hypothetical protein AB1489_13815 [Acidobacteriota bacterium]
MSWDLRKALFLSTLVITGLILCPQGFCQDQTTTSSREVKIYGVNVSTQSDPNPAPNINNPSPTTNPTTVDPLSTSEKLKYGFQRAFLSPSTYAFPAISATLRVRDEDKPNKSAGDKFADGLSHYARVFGTASSKNLLAYGVYPVLFKQDPRYERSSKRGVFARVAHASSRVFVTRGDNGNLQFNASLIAGNFTASALANVWERSSIADDRIGIDPTFRRFGTMIGFDIVRFIVVREFGPDIKKLFKRR